MFTLLAKVSWFGNQAKRYVDDKLDARMRKAGQVIKTEAKALVAVDTGALRSSIGYRYDRGKRTLIIHAYGHYAFYQEFGTRFMLAHPFIRPAIIKAGFFLGHVEILFPGVRKSKRPIPLVRANPAKMAHNVRINKAIQKRFRWRTKPVIAFRGRLARSLQGYRPPYQSRP